MSKRKPQKRKVSDIERTRRMARLVTVKGWDCDDEPTGFYGRFNFHPTVDKSKRVALHDYICLSPNLWEIEAHVHLRFADGSGHVEVWEAVTDQAITAVDTLEVRKAIRQAACAKINPKWIEDVVYQMRVVS